MQLLPLNCGVSAGCALRHTYCGTLVEAEVDLESLLIATFLLDTIVCDEEVVRHSDKTVEDFATDGVFVLFSGSGVTQRRNVQALQRHTSSATCTQYNVTLTQCLHNMDLKRSTDKQMKTTTSQ